LRAFAKNRNTLANARGADRSRPEAS